jgi:hypothetical protein
MMKNEIHSTELSADERLSEIAGILATGLKRLLARQSTGESAGFGESSLDFPHYRSGHPEDSAPENAR